MGTNISTYQPPVNRLLTLGRVDNHPHGYYLKFGFTSEHIPELVRMMMDPVLLSDETDDPEAMAVIHAWRVLGDLRAEAAIEPLMGLLAKAAQDPSAALSEWLFDDFADVFIQIGPSAVPSLRAFFSGSIQHAWANIAAADALAGIGKLNPEYRDLAVQTLAHELEHSAGKFGEDAEDYNAFIIGGLMRLGAVEVAPVIKAAFYADRVDPSIYGDWYSVKEELGLAEVDVPGPEPKREDPQSSIENFFPALNLNRQYSPPQARSFGPPKRKAQNKRKQEKKSRKQNRKRK